MAIKYQNTELFNFIGFPLTNIQWSWGSSVGNDVVLRCWQHQTIKVNNKKYIEVLKVDENYKSAGLPERQRHLDEIKNGAAAYIVIITCDDITAKKWRIKDTVQAVFKTGGVIKNNNIEYMELLDRIELRDFKKGMR